MERRKVEGGKAWRNRRSRQNSVGEEVNEEVLRTMGGRRVDVEVEGRGRMEKYK